MGPGDGGRGFVRNPDGHVAGRARYRSSTATADADSLRLRMVAQYSNHYGLIVSIFKGVSLFAAAASLLSILAEGGAAGPRWNAFAYWAASFITIAATYDSFMVGSLINTSRPNVIDVIAPFFIGLGEFLQFSVITLTTDDSLSEEASSAARLEQIAWWPLVCVALTVTALISMANFRSQLTRMIDDAPEPVRAVTIWYRAKLRKNQGSTAAVSCFMLMAFLVMRWGFPEVGFLRDLPEAEDLQRWQGVLGVVVCLGMAGVLREQEAVRRDVTDAFLAHPAHSATEQFRPSPGEGSIIDEQASRLLEELDTLRASDRRHQELLTSLRELADDHPLASDP